MKSLNRIASIVLCLLLVGLAVFSFPVDAKADEFPEPPQIPGVIEGTGTYFEVTDSEHLNITLASSEPVHVLLESVPEMVVMHLEAAEGATSADITLGGFAAYTTYHKYEDDYHHQDDAGHSTDGGEGGVLFEFA